MMRYITSVKLFLKKKLSISEESIQSFLDKVSFPEQNENQTLKCEGAITESELLKASSSMNNDKSPINKRNKRISRKLFGMLLKNHFVLLFNSLS